MTKNHILIKSVALGVLLMLSPLAKANNVDQVLIAYFNKLYPSNPQNCVIDSYTKTTLLADFEQKQCLNRITSEGQQYIAGFKSPCNEKDARASLDSQINAFCFQQVQKANAAAQAQARVQQQQPSASGGSSGGSSGGGRSLKQGLADVSKSLSQIKKIEAWAKKRDEAAAKKEEAAKGSDGKAVAGKADQQNSAPPTERAKEDFRRLEIQQQNASAQDPKAIAVNEARTEYKIAKEEFVQSKCGPTEDEGPCGELRATMSTAEQKAKANGGTVEGTDSDIAAGKSIADRQTNEGLRTAGKNANDEGKVDAEDPELKARHEKSRAEDASLKTQLEALDAKIKAMVNAIPAEATATCTAEMGMNPDCGRTQPAITCINGEQQKLITLRTELQKDKEACSNASAQAEKLCSMVRSEKAQNVQLVMSIGATILSKVTAASESCGTTSDLSKIAQGGILAAQGSCIAMKVRCDMSCESAKKTLEAMEKTVAAMKTCQVGTLKSAPNTAPQVDIGLDNLQAKLKEELSEGKSVPAAVTQCKNHKTDITTMGLAALGFLSAFQDAESCKKQLTAGGGGSGKSTSSMVTPTMTTAEYCSQPQNATSITCKCTANPSAEGCMGSMAGSGVALGKIGSGSGASAFASAKQNGLGGLDPLGKSTNGSSEPAPGSNLSEGAREALGIGGGATVDASSGGSPAGLSGNSENAKGLKDKEEKEKPKFGFFSSIGNMLSGGKSPNQAAKAAIRGYEQDQAIKRKLASDQIRAEITTASGKSNFDKIKSAYKANSSSFEQ